jgi:hypothetical protein
MRADKAGGGHNPSGSLRTSQPSTTKLSDSDKLMGSLTRMPDSPQGGEYVEFELPSDGTGNSLLVRPASGQATQVVGDLSRLGKKLRRSHESQTTKRTQSEAGIGEEGDDNRSMSKRQRTEETSVLHVQALGNTNASPIRQPAPNFVLQPVVQPGPRSGQQPIEQPIAQTIAQSLDRLAEPALVITPDTRAQIDVAEALRMARSITPFQPEQITQLFQLLCRSQLWQLLKLEEQRALYLMNLSSVVPMPHATASIGSAGAAAGLKIPSSSSSTTTTTTTMQPVARTVFPPVGTAYNPINAIAQGVPLPNPSPIARTSVLMIQTTPTASGGKASKVNENLLPRAPNPPSLDYARNLLSSLPEVTRCSMQEPAEKIKKMFDLDVYDATNSNKMTTFAGCLVEIASHGGLPHLDGELESIVQSLLDSYLKSHTKFISNKRAAKRKGSKKNLSGIDPVCTYMLRSLPKYPQYARMLGKAINKLPEAKRSHLSISRKFNYVLQLMQEDRSLSFPEVEFNKRMDKIVGDATAPEPSSTAPTASTPTSVPSEGRKDDSDESIDDTN